MGQVLNQVLKTQLRSREWCLCVCGFIVHRIMCRDVLNKFYLRKPSKDQLTGQCSHDYNGPGVFVCECRNWFFFCCLQPTVWVRPKSNPVTSHLKVKWPWCEVLGDSSVNLQFRPSWEAITFLCAETVSAGINPQALFALAFVCQEQRDIAWRPCVIVRQADTFKCDREKRQKTPGFYDIT